MACQHFPDNQTLRLQAGAGDDDVIHLPSGLDRVACKRQEEDEDREMERGREKERGGGMKGGREGKRERGRERRE